MADKIHRIVPDRSHAELLKRAADSNKNKSKEKLLIDGHNWDGESDPWAEFLIDQMTP